jgi:hypothetical protein
MASSEVTFSEVAKKVDGEIAELDDEDKALAVLESDLLAAQARVDSAEARYVAATKRVAEELAKPAIEEETAKPNAVVGEGRNEASKGVPEDVPEHTNKGSTNTKNTSARTEKEVGRDRWMAKKTAEKRVKDTAKKAKDRLRKYNRDKRIFMDDSLDAPPEETTAPQSAKAAPAKQERDPLYETDEIKSGAKSLALRLKSLKERPNEVDKKDGLLKVLTGGRDNYFTSEPQTVLNDLTDRALVDGDLATDLLRLLGIDVAKGTGVSPGDWLAHAQKVSGMERKDDEPFKEAEHMYLKWIDKNSFLTAEAELDAAEARLQQLIRDTEVSYPLDEEDEAGALNPAGDQQVDLDYAAKLEAQYDPKKESHGSKNTSQLSEKVVSSEKWKAERASETRDREKGVIAREARRSEGRDKKFEAADVDDA